MAALLYPTASTAACAALVLIILCLTRHVDSQEAQNESYDEAVINSIFYDNNIDNNNNNNDTSSLNLPYVPFVNEFGITDYINQALELAGHYEWVFENKPFYGSYVIFLNATGHRMGYVNLLENTTYDRNDIPIQKYDSSTNEDTVRINDHALGQFPIEEGFLSSIGGIIVHQINRGYETMLLQFLFYGDTDFDPLATNRAQSSLPLLWIDDDAKSSQKRREVMSTREYLGNMTLKAGQSYARTGAGFDANELSWEMQSPTLGALNNDQQFTICTEEFFCYEQDGELYFQVTTRNKAGVCETSCEADVPFHIGIGDSTNNRQEETQLSFAAPRLFGPICVIEEVDADWVCGDDLHSLGCW